jgi:hypothetical protein
LKLRRDLLTPPCESRAGRDRPMSATRAQDPREFFPAISGAKRRKISK